MKLSDKTLTLLKNFSSINQSILFKEGNSLRTISVMKNILAEATIEEELPKDFGIYDLNQFLNGLNLHQNAELDFGNDKAAAVYQLPDLSVVGEADVVKLVVRDKKNDTSNDFSIVVGETDEVFSFNFKVENIKIIPGSYEVVISQKLLSRFKNTGFDVTYYIALEPDSTFG